ncbi:MAG: hypothetical protein LAP61_23055 [Acidobacteriia bacterium]|nr:hypothetical protein [Terriglobia bacterium]
MNAGIFVDDDFVNVLPDAGLTAAANNDGFVPTAALEHVTAYNSIHATPFEDWTVVVGSETVVNQDLAAAEGTRAVAFAFYHLPSVLMKPPDIQDWTWVSWGVKVDAGGPTSRGPVPPWTPYIRQLAAAFALADAATHAVPELRAGILELAAKQLTIGARDISAKMKEAGKTE